MKMHPPRRYSDGAQYEAAILHRGCNVSPQCMRDTCVTAFMSRVPDESSMHDTSLTTTLSFFICSNSATARTSLLSCITAMLPTLGEETS